MKLKAAITLLLVVLALLHPYPKAGVRATTDPIEPLWGPYVTGTAETLTVVNWKTEAPTWGVVQYATRAQWERHGSFEDFVIDAVPRHLHRVRLTDLRPDEEYRYRIWVLASDVSQDLILTQNGGDIEDWLRAHGAVTRDLSFRTLGGRSFTFVVYGDTQEQYPWFTQMERHRLVADYIARERDISFVIHLGDFTYDADDLGGWDLFFEAGREMLANHTIYPVMGNHEDYSPVYYDIFGMPNYYAFQSSEARFLVLDTNSRADFEAQRGWLQDELSSPSRWDFIFYHHPTYSSDARNFGGWEMSRTHWEDVFVGAGATAVFSGHVHAYERYLVRGLHHFVVGTGGGLFSDLSPDVPADLQNRLAKTLGYGRVTVGSSEVTVDFVQVARISDDNRDVLEVYPFGSIFETVTLEPVTPQQAVFNAEADFRVSPVSLSIDVDRGESSSFRLRITSSDDAHIYVDTEDLPFEVKPAAFRIHGSEQPQWLDLELFGSDGIPNGEYEGRLTVLRDAGDNIALGVRVRTTVSQTGETRGLLDGAAENDVYLIIAVVVLIAANVGGYVAYRRYRSRVAGEKGV